MDIFEFTDRLCHRLEDMGISPKDCEGYIKRIKKNLSEKDLVSATDYDIEKVAEICLNLYRKKHPVNNEKEETADSDTLTFDIPDKNNVEDESSAVSDTIEIEFPEENNPKVDAPDTIEIKLPEYEETMTGTKGIFKTVLITFLLSPLWLIAAVLFFTPFVLLFAAEIAVTALLIALLAGGCAAGTAASLTGIVYGVVQMFSTPSIGLYEIGFGIILVGITFMFAVLSYNGAVRLMPFVFGKTSKLTGRAVSKIKPFLKEYVRRCQGL